MPQSKQVPTPLARIGAIAGFGAMAVYFFSRGNKKSFVLATAAGLAAYKHARPVENPPASAVFRVNATTAQAYELWHNFEDLPRFMAHLESVRTFDNGRSEWTAKAPLGGTVCWTAEITQDEPNRRIAWRSLPESQIQTSGSVDFQDDPQGRGCMVRATIEYSNPTGALGRALLTVMGKNPTFVVKEDLRRFKAILEAGEAPTTLGQPHGPRGFHGRAEQVLFRETSNRIEPQAASDAQAGAATAA